MLIQQKLIGRVCLCGFVAFAALALSLLPATTASANPNSHEPHRALAAHGTIEGAAELVNSMYELYNSEEQSLVKMYENKDDPSRLPFKQIGESSGKLWKARRDAELLKLMGEPAGNDLSTKMAMLALEYRKLAMISKGSPAGSKHYAALRTQLQRETPKRERFLEQAQKALQDGKLEIFEKTMESFGVDLNEKLVFFSPSEATPFRQKFDAILSSGDTMLIPQRRTAYLATVMEVVNKNLTAAKAFPGEATRIRNEIAASGSATLGEGASGDAAQAFAHVSTLWGNAAAGLMRIAALQWAYFGKISPELHEESKKLTSAAEQSLALLVQAAAQSTPSDKVVSTYAALLQQMSVVDRRVGTTSVSDACASAMVKLAEKDPTLANRIDNYQRATSEALNWRSRFAYLHAKELESRYPTATQQMMQQSPVTKTNKPEMFGRLTTAPKIVAGGNFSGPANWHVYESATRLVGKPLSDGPLIRLTPTSRTAVIPYRSHHYANVPVPMPSENEVADLKSALFVDDSHPPLSIAAANAISSAELHDYETIGGVVSKLHLEAAVTRFIALPDVAYSLSPLGSLPSLQDQNAPLTEACWRFDVIPHWAQHKYFVVKVETKTQ